MYIASNQLLARTCLAGLLSGSVSHSWTGSLMI